MAAPVPEVTTGLLLTQVAIGSAMILFSIVLHLGLMLLGERWFERQVERGRGRGHVQRSLLIGVVVLCFFVGICVEAWAWGLIYWWIGAVPTLEAAIYFSTVTFTTLGYGDVVIEGPWRLLSAFEATNGTIITGLTTAIVFYAVQRVLAAGRL